MTRFLTLFAISILSFQFSFAQITPCLPIDNGTPAGDNPPGCLLCSPVYQGSTMGFTADTFDYDFPCGTIENSQWIAFRAEQTGMASATILATECLYSKGVEMAIYDSNFNLVSNCFSAGDFQGQVTASNLTPNDIYYILVDGKDGDLCDILLIVPGGISCPPGGLWGGIYTLRDSSAICPGDTVCYAAQFEEGAVLTGWSIPDFAEVISESDDEICIRYNTHSTGDLRAHFINHCFGTDFSKTIYTGTLFEQTACPGEFPIEINGKSFDSYGYFRDSFPSGQGCDSVVHYSISQDTSSHTLYFSKNICPGDSVEFRGQFYSMPHTYEIAIQDPNQTACDTTILLTVWTTDTAAPNLFCYTDTSRNSINLKWDNQTGADGYVVRVNGHTIDSIRDNFYIYYPDSTSVQFDFEVEPYNRTCNFGIAKSSCAGLTVSSTSELKERTLIEVFPNPTTGVFEITGVKKISQIEVFDFSGSQVLRCDSTKVDMSTLASGIYFLKVHSEKGVFTKKLLKF